MDKVIFNSRYAIVSFNEETGIYSSRYLPETGNMIDEEFMELMLQLSEVFEKYKPKYIIDDNRDRLYAYPPDMQKWVLDLFVGIWNKIGLKKYVQIVPEDIINQITSDQIEEQANSEFEMHYEYRMVNNYESALAWINE